MKTLLVLTASLAVALPALAQEAEGDWDVARDAEKSMVIAYTVFDNGLGVGARCFDQRPARDNRSVAVPQDSLP